VAGKASEMRWYFSRIRAETMSSARVVKLKLRSLVRRLFGVTDTSPRMIIWSKKDSGFSVLTM
jgi:hypothetical protein